MRSRSIRHEQENPPMMTGGRGERTLVLGLGNPILSDDRVGLEIVREVAKRTEADRGVDVVEADNAGLDLLDLISGYARVVLVDAIRSAGVRPGSVVRLSPAQLPLTRRLAAIHEVGVATALELGRRLGHELPTEVVIYAVGVDNDREFGERMSPSVAGAVPVAATRILEELSRVEHDPGVAYRSK
jgi:hydrogenase maturation protease